MWKLNTNERVVRWRDFRKLLDHQSLDQAVQSTAEFWQSCPHAPYYLDINQPDSWPDPWQLISENYYCDLAKSLGMLYTLYFTSHRIGLDAEIHVYYDPATTYTYNLVVLCQGKYVLNFRDGMSVNITSINKNLELKKIYSSVNLRLQDY
jgi:hypothetical protein